MPPDSKEISKENDPLTKTRSTTWTESWMASPGPVTVAEHLNLFIKGLGMGTADIVPGVSGGTIAFITGIYHSLLTAISSINGKLFRQALRLRFKEALAELHLRFLITLVSGIAVALISTAHLMHYLLTEHPVPTWSIFLVDHCFNFGVGHSINNRVTSFPALALGTLLAYGITGLIPLHTPEEPWYIFFSGMIAICAMILPGLSGSFILLILGKYVFITAALRNPFAQDNLGIILIFIAGCIIGILGFSRFLRYGLERWHDFTLALLTGFMIGAMRKVWPWKITLESQIIRGKEHVLLEENVWPLVNTELWISILLMGVGFAAVMFLDKISKNRAGD
jgi:Predicted membrane protein